MKRKNKKIRKEGNKRKGKLKCWTEKVRIAKVKKRNIKKKGKNTAGIQGRKNEEKMEGGMDAIGRKLQRK